MMISGSDKARMGGAEPPAVVALAGLSHAHIEHVGGKAAGLGELLQARLAVPPGFCLTTAAYWEYVRESGLARRVDGLLAGIDYSDLSGLESVARAIQEMVVTATMPAPLATAIARAYTDLGEPAVAVRSSATAEDLDEASFAGQQQTFLNVCGAPDLLQHVQRCWASLWTARALHYRQRLGIDHRTVAMAVVVQALVPAEIAGVMFTANPLTGSRQELLINASFGLGEAIVSGSVTPDTYNLARATLACIHADIGAKEAMIVPRVGGSTTPVSVPPERRRQPALPDTLLHELAVLGTRVEAHFGGVPQDIEWAVADGRCWLLQARPITGLPVPPPEDMPWLPPTPGSAWIRRQVAENLPAPLSPLFAELYVRQGLERSLDSLLDFFRMPWFHLDTIADRPFFTTINGYAYQRANFKWSWRIVPVIVRATAASWPVMVREAVPHWRDHALPTYLATIERWKRLDSAAASSADLLAGVRELASADATYWYVCALVIANAKWSDWLLDRFLALALPGRHLTSALLLRGFPSMTLEAQATLEGLAAQIRAADELLSLVASTPVEGLLERLATSATGRAVLDSFQDYLEHYGHRIYNLDFAEPTQVDDPWPVLLSLKAMAQRVDPSVRVEQVELARERDARVPEIVRSLDPLRRLLFLRLLGWAQRCGPYREEALFYIGAAWPLLRRLAHELGHRLVQAGALTASEDVFFLESTDIEAAMATLSSGTVRPDLAVLARERRERRDAQARLHPPAAVPPSSRLQIGPFDLSAWETQRRNPESATQLRGYAVSPGRVTARASVIRSRADFDRMEPGTILVCPTTTPAWTPLFSQASGLVTDVGGILAHGSIVAREYGIPAVMGTGSASERVAHGQIITVDGDRGQVVLAEGVTRPFARRQHIRGRRAIVLMGTAGLLVLARWLWHYASGGRA